MSEKELNALVRLIWSHAPGGEPDLTGLGRLRICTQNVEFAIRAAVARERERAAKLAEAIGEELDDGLAVNAGYEIAKAIREGK